MGLSNQIQRRHFFQSLLLPPGGSRGQEVSARYAGAPTLEDPKWPLEKRVLWGDRGLGGVWEGEELERQQHLYTASSSLPLRDGLYCGGPERGGWVIYMGCIRLSMGTAHAIGWPCCSFVGGLVDCRIYWGVGCVGAMDTGSRGQYILGRVWEGILYMYISIYVYIFIYINISISI